MCGRTYHRTPNKGCDCVTCNIRRKRIRERQRRDRPADEDDDGGDDLEPRREPTRTEVT